MQHKIRKVKITGQQSHLRALLRNLAGDLIMYEKIKTTRAKAKAVQPFIDRLIATAKRKDKINGIRYLNARLNKKLAGKKIIEELVKRYQGRESGFTRIVRLGFRRGDAAPMVQISLV